MMTKMRKSSMGNNIEKMHMIIVINQLYKGGAENALVNMLHTFSPSKCSVDLVIFDHSATKLDLISEIPSWINVITPRKPAIVKRIKSRLHSVFGLQSASISNEILAYINSKRYDLAVLYGEWFPSKWLLENCSAKWKCVWIHSDVNKANFVHQDVIGCRDLIDFYIFVSDESRKEALKKYPWMSSKSFVIHNVVSYPRINKLSLIPLGDDFGHYFDAGTFVLLTVANFRPEKNHFRQLEILKDLKEKGYRIKWINVGSQANKTLVNDLLDRIKQFELENDFILLDAVENPYPLMRRADAICVLSDHESWSMVITEAKLLGIPVIATKTSGAREQIIDGQNGVLCDFSKEDIEHKVEDLINGSRLKKKLGSKGDCLAEGNSSDDVFEILRDITSKKKVVYIIDDINYMSGARAAAFRQIDFLKNFCQVRIVTGTYCQNSNIDSTYDVISIFNNPYARCLLQSFSEVWNSQENKISIKLFRLFCGVLRKTFGIELVDKFVSEYQLKKILKCDVVCVISEGSKFRKMISKTNVQKKIQWIHTDYSAWRNISEYTKKLTREDESIYPKFDVIVCLSETIKEKFLRIFPNLKDKVWSIGNFIDYAGINKKAEKDIPFLLNRSILNLITIGRYEPEKNYNLILKIACQLKQAEVKFNWFLVGFGYLFNEISQEIERLNLSDNVLLLPGFKPLGLLKHCDALVLVSVYEGTPVTIDEAKVLNVPVFAKDIGGISDQLAQDAYGATSKNSDALGLTKDLLEFLQNLDKFKSKRFTSADCNKYNTQIEAEIKKIFLDD